MQLTAFLQVVKQSATGGLAKTLKLKIGAKVMLTINTDIQDRLINGQIGLVKHFEIINNDVATIFIKFDDANAGRNLILTNSFAMQNNSIPIKKSLTQQYF